MIGDIWVFRYVLSFLNCIEERYRYRDAMTVTILCVEYLAGDDIVFDAFRDVFTSELVQVRGE